MSRGRLEPRPYQRAAAEWALRKGRAVVCLPTGTGKTLVAWLWAERLLSEGKARRILFLEPTRFMVEQVAGFLEKLGVEAAVFHGSVPRGLRRLMARGARVVVATPEAVVADLEFFRELRFDAVIVDECHHTTGQDAYVTVVKSLDFRYRLGLTPLVPLSRRREIEEYIGEIWCRGWDDPEIARYIPLWAGEVYEAPFNEAESRLYTEIEARWEDARERGSRSLLGNSLRWMARDGPLALRESYARSEKLKRLLHGLEELLRSREVRDLHKLPSLYRALRDHEDFSKAIVFVERVSVARALSSALKLAGYKASLLVGRRWEHPGRALEEARSPETRVVVATSAGEEGIDMPEADLVAVWSNVASPLRFVQRLGRMLRASPLARSRQKFAVFLATPDTVDVDALADGIVEAQRSGVAVNLEPDTIRRLLETSRRRKILEALEERPMTLDLLAQALRAPLRRIETHVNWLLRRGLLVYIYTSYGRVYAPSYAAMRLRELYTRETTPSPGVEATITAYASTGKEARIRGDRETAGRGLHRLLIKWGRIQRLRAYPRILEKGVLHQYSLTYAFPVESRELLDLVLDNVYSGEWRRADDIPVDPA